HFLEQQGTDRYALYLQDYGGPVGFRVALAHPERVRALVVQNAVAHERGLSELWAPRRAFWADRGANEAAVRENLLSLAATGYGTSVTVRIPSRSTRTPGRASTHFSPGPAWWTSTSTCSTTIGPTSRPTRGGRRISASGSRRRWWCGASTTFRSRWPVRWPSARTWPPPRCTCSTPGTSPSTRPHRRSLT